jgi:hypothetical protein
MVLGENASVSGGYGLTAIGYGSVAGSGNPDDRTATAIGYNCYAKTISVAIGALTVANYDSCIAIGYSISTGNYSQIMIGNVTIDPTKTCHVPKFPKADVYLFLA